MTAKKWSPSEAKAVYEQAQQAGYAAGAGMTPTPMIVVSPSTPLGNDIDYNQRTYYVPEGVCGFAWVVAPGNSSFVQALKASGMEISKAYPTGVYVRWVHEFGQSYERKQKYAHAFSKTLIDAGVEGVYSGSRLD